MTTPFEKNFDKLPKEEKMLLLTIIRLFIEKSNMCEQLSMGLEEAEENVITLLKKGWLKMIMDEEYNIMIVPSYPKEY